MITIGNLYEDGIDNSLKRYAIVRTIKGNQELYDEQESLLSPSISLLNLVNNLRKNGNWNKETFNRYYVPNFLYEMKARDKRKRLTAIYKEGINSDIILLCHCSEEELCHRSIIAGFLQGAAKETGIELVNCNNDYSEYYNMFRKL